MSTSLPENLKVSLHQGDIGALDVDAIVISMNNDLILGAGVSGRIRREGGDSIQEECHKIGTIPLGEVAVSTSGNLRSGKIIHAAVNPLGLWADRNSVRTASTNALKKAQELKFKSLAMIPIGCDAGAFSLDQCAEIMIDLLGTVIEENSSLAEIIFALYDEKEFEVFASHWKEKFPETDFTPPSSPVRIEEVSSETD
jgi:O-acetyl-ADP-ribose deacetylase (regulator of RNase III)